MKAFSPFEKSGNLTMGGIIILAAVIVTSLFYVKDYPKIIPVLFPYSGVWFDRILMIILKLC